MLTVSVALTEDFCVSALERVLLRLHPHQLPKIFDADQGSQYTGVSFTSILKEHGIKISMNGRGRAMDNIMVERLWRTVKHEKFYLRIMRASKISSNNLKTYFEFYNHIRPHQAFERKSPAEIYWGESKQKKAA